MRVILIYDIALEDNEDQKRLNKVRKIAKRYIHHIQKSVFEGDLTETKLEKLKKEILSVIDKKRDSVIIYTFDNLTKFNRMILTDIDDPMNNII